MTTTPQDALDRVLTDEELAFFIDEAIKAGAEGFDSAETDLCIFLPVLTELRTARATIAARDVEIERLKAERTAK